jgi:hypothetical protein
MKATTIEKVHTCQSEFCEKQFDIQITLPTPDKNIFGRMEDCIQGDPMSIEPNECPYCSHPINYDLYYDVEA